MFCKVCKDAGKSEREYRSHIVKNKKGKTICPTLLNQTCKYCRETGHTVKYCSILKLNEKNKRREEYFKNKNKEWQEELNSAARKLGSSFSAAFGSETEEETEDEWEDENCRINIDLNEKVGSYARVLVDDYVAQVENVKDDSAPFTIDTSHLKGKFWGDDDSDSDEE